MKHIHHRLKSKKDSFSSGRLNKTNLTVFAIAFALIGGYIIFRSFAATPTVANLWIDTNGGTCTYSSTPVAYNDAAACGTFDAAWDKASTGNTIVVKAGIYVPQKVNDGAPTATPPKTSETKFIGEGDGDDVIIRNNDTECEPIYGANSSFCAQAPYMTLENMVLDTANVFGANSAMRIWNDSSDGHTPFYTAHHVTLRNVDFWGTYPNMQVNASDFRWLGGSHGKDGVANTPICAGGSEPVWLADAADRTIIDGVRFNPKIIQESGCDPHIETIRLQGDPDDVTIKNSWFMGGGGACSGHIFTGAGTTSNNVRIINNVFEIPCNNNPIHQASGTCDWYWAYNTFYKSGVDSGCNSGTNTSVWIGNIGVSAHCSGTHYNNVWAGAANGTACGGADKVVTNLGLSVSGGKLQAGSGAIDAITDSTAANFCTTADNPATLTVEGLGSIDFEGHTRPVGSACDAGADEFGSSPPNLTANLWVDNNGGTCTRQGTAGAYVDAQSCTWDQANDLCQTGDTVLVKGAAYGNISITGSNGRTGTSVCTFKTSPGDTVTVGTFTNGHVASGGGGGNNLEFIGPVKSLTFRADNTSRVSVDNWDIDAGGQAQGITQPFHVENASNFSLKNSKVHNSYNANSMMWLNGNNFTFDNNDIYDNVNNTDGAIHDECMYAYDVDQMTLTRNHFWSCSVMDVFVNGPVNATTIATDWLVENNVFEAPLGSEGNSRNALTFSGGSHPVIPDNFVIRNNTFGNSGILIALPDSNPTARGMVITGNYFAVNAYTSNAQPAPCGAPNTTYSYNVTPTGVSNCGGTGAQSFSLSSLNAGFVNYRAYSGNNGSAKEPAGDYHLTSSSPLINAGAGSGSPSLDRDGNSRPNGVSIDIGAYEYTGSATPPPAPPPTPPPTPPPGPPPPPSSQTPIAMYNFDEGTGTLANDSSTNNFDLTMPSSAWTATGKNSKAANFSGGNFASASSSVSIGSTGTIEAWVKLNATGQWHGIVGKGSGNNDATHNYAMEVDNTNKLRCILGNNTTSIMAVSSGTLTSGTYYHLACSWNGTTLSAYINGGTPNTATQSLTPASNTDPLYVGQYASGVDTANAAIDDLRIYNKALTQSEIQGDSAVAVGSSSTPKTGDLNSDGQVNIFDLSILLSDYGKTKAAANNQACDINNDNTINIFDLSILLSKYGS